MTEHTCTSSVKDAGVASRLTRRRYTVSLTASRLSRRTWTPHISHQGRMFASAWIPSTLWLGVFPRIMDASIVDWQVWLVCSTMALSELNGTKEKLTAATHAAYALTHGNAHLKRIAAHETPPYVFHPIGPCTVTVLWDRNDNSHVKHSLTTENYGAILAFSARLSSSHPDWLPSLLREGRYEACVREHPLDLTLQCWTRLFPKTLSQDTAHGEEAEVVQAAC